MLTSNADLRQEIDSLRVERKRFEGVYKKLDKELVSLRRQIAEAIDQSTLAYDSRYECYHYLTLLCHIKSPYTFPKGQRRLFGKGQTATITSNYALCRRTSIIWSLYMFLCFLGR